MKTIHQSMIEQFMRGAKQIVPESPSLPPEDVRLLRAKLIMEEAIETCEALGYKMKVGVADHAISVKNLDFVLCGEPSLVEIADGCADISVVTIGCLSACGIEDYPILFEVDRNNLDKLGPGATIRDDGKLVKPPNHKPPNLLGKIQEQIERVRSKYESRGE